MKPGKGDTRYKIRITGTELAVLHKLTFAMVEAFGLDRKIEKYKGTRAITLYSWDLDCLEAVIWSALRWPERHEIADEMELDTLKLLDTRFRELRRNEKES